MSLTRKFLSSLEIDGDKADEIIKAHSAVVDALKDERDKLKAEAEKVSKLNEKVEELQKLVDKSKDNPYKEQYEELKEEFEKYKSDISAKQTKETKTNAYKELLKAAGVSDKRINSIAKVSSETIEKIEIGEDGKVKDADALKKSITEEWADFIVKENKQGANTSTPPANNGGTATTKEEIMKIKDAGERQKAIADNHELFGF